MTLRLLWTSSGRFPCTLWCEIRTLLTGCFEYPWATWCTPTRRCRRLCRNMREQVQRRFDFGTTLSSLIPCCILSDISSGQQIELKMLILNRRRRLFHSSRVKLPFVNMSASWFLVSTYLIWVWRSKLILPNNLSSATLWVGIRVSMLNFYPWWSSWSLLHYLQKCRASHQIEKTSRLEKHNRRCIIQDRCTELESWCVFLMCFLDGVSCSRFPCTFSLDFSSWLEEECNTSITKSQRSRAGNPSLRRPASRENNFRFRRTVWDRSWLLAHPTYWNKRMTSKYAQNFPWGRFWVFKISGKVRALKCRVCG